MAADHNAPELDIRVRGFRMTVQRIPPGLVTLLVTCAGFGLTAWFTTR